MSSRAVVIDDERIKFLEQLGLAFVRAGEDATGTKLLGIVLAWRVSPEVDGIPDETYQPDNVVELHSYSKKVGA